MPTVLGALELAARVERLALAVGASDVSAGGAWGGALSLRWWINRWLATSVVGYVMALDRAPLEAPDTTTMASLVARLTVKIP